MTGIKNDLTMRLMILLASGWLFAATLTAQTLTGRIVDTKGQPIPNATCYIRSLTLGLVADGQGEFRTKIAPGDYTCEISSIGYERKRISLSIPPEGFMLEAVLSEKIYPIREVSVTPGKEDPAYPLMRKVISRAPYHLHQVKNYESEVYVKGTFKVAKVPALIKRQIKNKETREMIGKTFLLEMQNEITYHEPDRYEHRVIAISHTLPPEMIRFDNQAPVNPVTSNIYAPSTFGGLLAPGSFSLYRFRLEDSYEENGRYIYKIRVIPRKKSGQLVSGHLYVVDDTWNIQQANLRLSQSGTAADFNLSYQEIKPGAFLPVTVDISLNFDLLGVKANGQLYASIRYRNLEIHGHVVATADDTTAVRKPSPVNKQQKALDKLEKLAQKEKLSTREAYQMARLMTKTLQPEELRKQQQQLAPRITVTRDSLALLRDSAYWAGLRNLPLREEERQSYLRRDSLRKASTSVKDPGSADKKRGAGAWVANLLSGQKINTEKKIGFKYDGLLRACPEYNFVDGFLLGQKTEVEIRFHERRRLSLSPTVYYTTARKAAIVTFDAALTYAPAQNGEIAVSAGNTTADFAGKNGTGRFGNSLASILFAGNTAKFYRKEFLTLAHRIHPANGLMLDASLHYEKRNDLENNTSWHIFGGKRPASNRPHGQTDRMPTHEALTAAITLEYTPGGGDRRFSGSGGPFLRRSAGPTLRLDYSKAFGNKMHTSFDRIEATVSQDIRLNLFNRLSGELNVGIFASSRQIYLPDFKHFRTNEMFLTGKLLHNSFSQLDNYVCATDDKWLQAHLTYTSQYLLIKQLPFLQGYPFDESLHLHTLWLPRLNYNEAGYSIGFGNLGRVGLFVGFDGLQYESTGFILYLPLMNLR
jgi:hypothetical protein